MVTTPKEITEEILEFCKEIDSTTKPNFLELSQVEEYICEECYGNVENHIKKNGGGVQYGWIIWEDPKIFLEGEFHAVWVNSEGKYTDVTPKVDGEDRILFLPDSKKKFTGELIDNIRKPLVDNAYTRTQVRVEERKFEIKKKYYDGSIQIKIPKFEIDNLERYRVETLLSEIKKDKLMGKMKIGRNQPCPCGSGKKYKKCCINTLQ